MERCAQQADGDGCIMTAFIAKTVQSDQYVVLVDNKVVAGPFASAAEAAKIMESLLATGTASGCCD
jgi:hypothetical protein